MAPTVALQRHCPVSRCPDLKTCDTPGKFHDRRGQQTFWGLVAIICPSIAGARAVPGRRSGGTNHRAGGHEVVPHRDTPTAGTVTHSVHLARDQRPAAGPFQAARDFQVAGVFPLAKVFQIDGAPNPRHGPTRHVVFPALVRGNTTLKAFYLEALECEVAKRSPTKAPASASYDRLPGPGSGCAGHRRSPVDGSSASTDPPNSQVRRGIGCKTPASPAPDP
jgi:hypothetical protein